MFNQTVHYEEICEFVTHFEGRRKGASLLIHSVPLLREKRKKRKCSDGKRPLSLKGVHTAIDTKKQIMRVQPILSSK